MINGPGKYSVKTAMQRPAGVRRQV